MHKKAVKLPQGFYLHSDVVGISRRLLGKVLATNNDGKLTAGIIVETEAYAGHRDRASHAWKGSPTGRTEIMYRAGGLSYVYLIYGMHVLFNVVTNKAGIPDAVLIRAIEPTDGVEVMLDRRKMTSLKPALTNGPGKLTKALGIDLSFYGLSLTGDKIWIEDQGLRIPESEIESGVRIGVDYAGEHAKRPWRFWIKGNPFVSR